MTHERIRRPDLEPRIMSADEAALLLHNGDTVGISGFTRAGDPKSVPQALARRVQSLPTPFHIQLWTGASVAEEVDEVLTRAGIVARRLPFQSNPLLREAINEGRVMYTDQHLSKTSARFREGQLGHLNVAILEVAAITEDGGLVPTTSVGNSPTFAMMADKVIVELNLAQSPLLEGLHDILIPGPRPFGKPVVLRDVRDRIGTSYIPISPEKIAAIVLTDRRDHLVDFQSADEETIRIGDHLLDFLEHEVHRGHLPETLFPLQSGVGTLANGVLSAFHGTRFHDLEMYSEVLQDAAFELIDCGKVQFASGCAITASPQVANQVLNNLDFYRSHIVLRPQEISNHGGVLSQLGVIAMNTALEADIYGNINSTHLLGTHMMNGIGGSGDFARNAYLSIFMTKSTKKKGSISSIVPMVSHVDHTEHDIDILVTEEGLADLRGLSPRERAKVIIENCVNPYYRDALRDYYHDALKFGGHTPHLLEKALSWHIHYKNQGTMQTEPASGDPWHEPPTFASVRRKSHYNTCSSTVVCAPTEGD